MRIQLFRFALGAGALFWLVTGAAASSISGRVLTRVGEGQAGQVRAFRLKVQDGHVDRFPSCMVDTTPDGQFACNDVEPGHYIIQVLATPHGNAEKTKRITPEIFFYPGVSDLALATQIDVRASVETWLDLTVPTVRRFKVSGNVSQVPRDADLRLEAYGHDVVVDTAIRVTRTKDDEFLAEQVPSGNYVLSAVWRDKTIPHRLAAKVNVVAADVTNVTLNEEPYVMLHGTLEGEAAARVKTLLLYREENDHLKWIVNVQDGRFALPTLPAGRYYLALPIHSPEYISNIRQEDHEINGATFSVASETEAADIQVSIASPGSELTGSVPEVEDTGRRARIVAEEIASKQVSTVLTNDSGRFSMNGLRPGSYLLFAWPEDEDPPYRSVDVLRSMEQNATSVTVEKGTMARSDDLPLLHPRRP